jgi:N-acetylglucosaminyldiphosphoundecaprenol N-acetyl-beta-D-mannosaminyltransferase
MHPASTIVAESAIMTSPGNTEKVSFGGVAFDNVTMAEAIDRIGGLIERGRPAMVVTPNVDHLLRLQRDREYAGIVARADLVLVDGQPIVWASRLLGRPLKQRVPGSDLFPQLCARAAERGYRVYFLGGDPGAAEAARRVLVTRHAGLQIVGVHCPPYGFESSPDLDRAAVEAVRSAAPDILFVGLGSPKQEKWIAGHMDECGARVSIGIGVSFSFVAGHVKRAPVWLQRMGLEWLHRCLAEPGRLWKRYLLRGPAFIPLVLKEFWRSRCR